MEIDLALVWGGIIAFGVAMYVLLDGFDLGIGILYPFAPGTSARDAMMNSVAPIWDGNETWLVLGGTALLGAFPIAYAVLLPAFYLPISIMLLGLILRGVAFEFRFKTRRARGLWSASFAVGSAVATFAQGMVLGAFVQGVPVADRQYAGGPFDWVSGFSVLTGLGLAAGYALLGATWLVAKTEGPLNAWARRASAVMTGLVLLFMAAVSLWVPFLDTEIERRWFSWPNLLYLSPVPILVAVTTGGLLLALRRRRRILPFLAAIGLFLLGYAGLAISLWPNVVPPEISIWEAASDRASQVFLLVGVAILIPITLAYTAWSYWVFRGKVDADAGYH